MKKTELINGILELGESLKDAEGMGALVDINEMELLVDKYVQELGQTLPIDNVSKSFYCNNSENDYKDTICKEQCIICKWQEEAKQ